MEHLDRVKIRDDALLTYQLIGTLDYNIGFVEVNYNNWFLKNDEKKRPLNIQTIEEW